MGFNSAFKGLIDLIIWHSGQCSL